MDLSASLIKEFAKTVNNNSNKSNTETQMRGTAKIIDGKRYVVLDGSNALTPISTVTDAQDGDRVLVSIVNHQATIIGNFTYPPSARETNAAYEEINYLKSVSITTENLEARVATLGYATIQQLDAAYAEIEQLEAKTITADNLSAKVAELGYATVDNLDAMHASIQNLEAKAITTDTLEANVAKLDYAKITDLEAVEGKIDDLESKSITTDNLEAQVATLGYAKVTDLEADYAKITDLEATEGRIDTLTGDFSSYKNSVAGQFTSYDATITELKAVDADLNKAIIDKADITDLEATEGKIDTLTGDFASYKTSVADQFTSYDATITELKAKDAELTEAVIARATITQLEAVEAKITDLEAGVADIESLVNGNLTSDNIQSLVLSSDKVTVENGFIKNAMIESLTFDKITGVDINTTNILVHSNDGKSKWSDNTIQISDANRVRVQIGKDASGDYNIYIWDVDGNLMFDPLYGVQESGIKRAIIRDDMVTDDANIAGSKLNIPSVIEEVNGSTTKLKSSAILYDEKNQTLDVFFGEMITTVDGLTTTTETHSTQINVMQGQISTLINNTTITKDGETIQLKDAYNATVTDIDSIKTTISEHTSKIDEQSGQITAVQTKANTIESDLNGTKQTISEVQTDLNGTKSTVSTIQTDLSGLTARVAANETAIEDKADGSTVETLTTRVGSFEVTLEGLESRVSETEESLESKADGSTVTSLTTRVGSVESSLDGLTSRVSATETSLTKKADGSTVATLTSRVGTVESTVDGLTSRVSETEESLESKADGSTVTALTTRVGTVESSLDGLTARVATNETNISKKADNSTVTTLTNRVSSFESTLDGLTSRVSATESALDEKADGSTVESLTTRVGTFESTLDGFELSLATTNQTVEDNYNKIISRGEQLVVNGNGLTGDNTNFSAWIYDGAVTNNSPGSFTLAQGVRKTVATDEYFPVNPEEEYTLSIDAKSLNGLSKMYAYIDFYDVDKRQINVKFHMYLAGSTTKLAQDLKSGDTVIYVEDLSGWQQKKKNHQYITFWNYTNSFGYTYPKETYSRNRLTLPSTSAVINDGVLDFDNNTITLTTAYSGSTIPAGTDVSQGGDGSTYKYLAISNVIIPAEWTTYTGVMSGVDYSGGNVSGKFPPGTAYAKVGFLWNHNTADDQVWVTNITVYNTTGVSNALDAAKEYTDGEVTVVQTGLDNVTTIVETHTEQISSHDTRISAVEGEISLKVSSSTFESYKTTVTSDINAAKASAISTAASDATTKANNAKSAAISAAASDATTKANNAKSAAISESKSYTNTQITTVNEKISDINAELVVVNDSISAKVEQKDIDTAVTEMTEYVDGEISTVTTEVSNVKNTVASHTTSLNSITSRVSETESDITTINGNVTSLTSRMTSAEQKITADAIVSTVRSSTSYQSDLADKASASELDAAETRISTVEQDIDSWSVKIEDAATKATSFLKFDTDNYVIVGDMTGDILGNNVQITTTGINIRDGETTVASFGEDLIQLGINSTTSKISLCGDLGTISAGELSVMGYKNVFTIKSNDVALVNSTTDCVTNIFLHTTDTTSFIGLYNYTSDSTIGTNIGLERNVIRMYAVDGSTTNSVEIEPDGTYFYNKVTVDEYVLTSNGWKNVQNGVTTTIQSSNSYYTHYTTTALSGHYFNKSVYVAGHIYGTSSYNRKVAYDLTSNATWSTVVSSASSEIVIYLYGTTSNGTYVGHTACIPKAALSSTARWFVEGSLNYGYYFQIYASTSSISYIGLFENGAGIIKGYAFYYR